MYEGEVESLSDAGGRGIGVRAFVDGRCGLRLRHRPLRRRARATRHAPRARRPRWPTPDECAGLPERLRRHAGGRASPPPSSADWSTERKVELALAVERAARAREGVTPGRDRRSTRTPRPRVALANSRGFTGGLRGDPGLGLHVGVRRRGRRPDDRPRGRPGPRPRARSTPRRSAARPPSARWRWSARASPRAAAARWCSTRSSRRRSSASSAAMLSADAVQRGRSLFAGTRGGGGGATRRFELSTTAPTPRGPPARPSTARARRPGGRR